MNPGLPLPPPPRAEQPDAACTGRGDHLRDAVDGLPRAPGVYTFHGPGDGLPLYIGKSVDIRARVLSHLRNPDEATMLRQARRVSYERTAGEIGALLLESRLIKAQQPLYNQRLRRRRRLYAWRVADGRLELVDSTRRDFAHAPSLYGLSGGRRQAEQRLREIADTHRLCLALLGLERPVAGRRCFRAQIGRCAGACGGAEPRQAHDARLLEALQAQRIVAWPHAGAVALVERHGALRDLHVVRNWCHLGTVRTLAAARALDTVDAGFDADSYRILCGPIVGGQVECVAL